MCIGGNQAFGITHTINFKEMTTINTDYNNTELLDQELNFEELKGVAGGSRDQPLWQIGGDHKGRCRTTWLRVLAGDYSCD